MESHEWKGNLDLLNIIMIGLAEEVPGKEKKYELHRLLGAVLSEKMKTDEKLEILEKEYHIPMEQSLEKEMKSMCNLSDGIEERALEAGRREGIETGRKEGIEIGIKSGKKELLRQKIEKKLAKGKSVEVIADELKEEVASIQRILDEIEAEVKEK